MRLYCMISIGVFWGFLGVYVFDQFFFSRGKSASVAIAMFVWSTEYGVLGSYSVLTGCIFVILDMGNSISGCRRLIRFMVQHADAILVSS